VSGAVRARAALAVFGRAPASGTAKTRLAGATGAGGVALGPEGAARIYAAFLADTLATAARVAAAGHADVALWVAGAPDDASLCAVPGVAELPRVAQPEVDLGARMRAALDAGVASHGRALVVGSDAPTLPAEILVAACEAFARVDLVLGPAADGGYVLVGSRVPLPPEVFAGARFSTPHARADTLAGARRAGLSVACVAPWYDVDTPDDLRLLRLHLALAPEAAPHTARALGAL
jgi:rSAM/selenodomain-associated transferase 1